MKCRGKWYAANATVTREEARLVMGKRYCSFGIVTNNWHGIVRTFIEKKHGCHWNGHPKEIYSGRAATEICSILLLIQKEIRVETPNWSP